MESVIIAGQSLELKNRKIALLEMISLKPANEAQAQAIAECLAIAKAGSGVIEKGSMTLKFWDRISKIAGDDAEFARQMEFLSK